MDRNYYSDKDCDWVRVVALRKESVDRNTMRRDFKRLGLLVALRKESVDRNLLVLLFSWCVSRRSPQGERG